MIPQNQRTLVIAILLSGLIIGWAIFYTRSGTIHTTEGGATTTATRLASVRPVQANDHVWGNPNAKMVFIVYSDFVCPFCKEFHTTMHNIIEYYGTDGSVAWVFRHIPIVQLHKEAPMYALASECVAQLGGNQAFWKFSDSLFAAITIDTQPDTDALLALAEGAGIERPAFASCMRSNELMTAVTRDFNEAVAAGASASPFTVLITPDGRTSFEGARDFKTLSVAIMASLKTQPAGTLVPPTTGASTPFDQVIEPTDASGTDSIVPTGPDTLR